MEISAQSNKIYIVLVGSAPMASLDALMLSLERFKNILGSDSAKSQFETTLRSIQPSLHAVNAFIEKVYAEKNPTMAVTMKGRTLIVEVALSKNEFLNLINCDAVDEILSHIMAVGSMPANKVATQTSRDYISFPVKYIKGEFKKF
ncbi:MAG: hypothetical protein H0W64_09495 [Gammaproteobacteria bacterium]|nr:hypothetical protein [Gammaproteobacteria bacterium]